MKRGGRLFLAASAGALLLSGGRPAAALDPSRADEDAKAAIQAGGDAFCKHPELPLTRRARRYCAIAKEITGCDALRAACDEAAKDDLLGGKEGRPPQEAKPKPLEVHVPSSLGALAHALIWILIGAIVLLVGIPILRAILKNRRDQKLAEPIATDGADPADAPGADAPPADAESLLASAAEHARRGEPELALQLYLAAALRALDTRGAIRISKDRTNGEYLRSCREETARAPLRDIVLEVDRVQFGGEPASADAVMRAARWAVALVRAAPVALLALAAFLLDGSAIAAKGLGPSADPAGDDVLVELLGRQGMKVSRLGSSLASLPMPKPSEFAPAVLVDVDTVPLDDETSAHLVEWVKEGGVLVLAGDPLEWPKELHARRTFVSESTIAARALLRSASGPEGDDGPVYASRPQYAQLLDTAALEWRPEVVAGHAVDPAPVAWFTRSKGAAPYTGSEAVYAGVIAFHDGRVLGITTDELLTDIALARPGAAATLVAILSNCDRSELKIASAEDGLAPPTNPVSALSNAGLGLGMLHGLAFALLLFLAYGIRLARPKPTDPARRRAFTEHIVATGALYARTGVAPHALAVYARHLDDRLRTRLPRGTTDVPAFLAARTKSDPRLVEALWSRARNARSGDPPRGDELDVMQRLGALYRAALGAE
jgi:uncharacterized protein DUF4350